MLVSKILKYEEKTTFQFLTEIKSCPWATIGIISWGVNVYLRGPKSMRGPPMCKVKHMWSALRIGKGREGFINSFRNEITFVIA